MQEEIFQSEVNKAHKMLTEFSNDFEELYCQCQMD